MLQLQLLAVGPSISVTGRQDGKGNPPRPADDPAESGVCLRHLQMVETALIQTGQIGLSQITDVEIGAAKLKGMTLSLQFWMVVWISRA